MRIGYNTNGFAHHRLDDAIAILAEIGYESVAITLDYHALNPFDSDLAGQTERIRRILQAAGLKSVIETGARFLLDARRKHEPTLLSASAEERDVRSNFLCRAIDVAEALGSDAVSFWSGTVRDGSTVRVAMERLIRGCESLLRYAESRSVRLAFEPEPGMFVERMSQFADLARHFDSPWFGLTLDVGHIHCLADGAIVDALNQWREQLFNVHIEDMRRGVHDHLMFGDGEIEFAPIIAKLREIGYAGGVHVELSRHSHDAVRIATKALEFLRGC